MGTARSSLREARRVVIAGAVITACSTSQGVQTFGTTTSGSSGERDAGDAAKTRDAQGAPESDVVVQAEAAPLCTDCDHDGYERGAGGDCNDNDPLVNPDAYDFIGDGIDNDCDGVIDDPVLTCPTTPASAPGSPLDFARSADLCVQKALTHTGKPFDPVVNAQWGEVSGLGATPGGGDAGNNTLWTSKTKDQQINIVSSFGANMPQAGPTMFGLSNGPWAALAPRTSAPLDPLGFNLANACSDIPLLGDDCLALTGNQSAAGVSVQDWGELTLWVDVPVNVGGMSFDFSFFSSEFNEWWQSSANDAFFALVTSKTIAGKNVARDSHGYAITVNSGFFQLCPTSDAGIAVENPDSLQQCVGVNGSSAVPGTLANTGYNGAGSGWDAGEANDTVQNIEGLTYVYGGGTGWLTASFPVTPGEELEIRIVIMDTYDGIKDSMVLVDHFAWQATAPAATGVTRPPK